jgi:hypothetical protein
LSGLGGGGGSGAGGGGAAGGGAACTGGNAGCTYTVYAHSNTELYSIDLTNKTLVDIGSFKVSDSMTDLAVAPDDTIYTVTESNLYTANPTTGVATLVGSLKGCGMDNVALSMTPDGKLWLGDGAGSFCEVDISKSTPPTLTVTVIGTLGSGLVLSGDIVGVDDGTLYGTAIDTTSSTTKTTTTASNLLVTVDPTTGKVLTTVGATGFPQLYGVAYAYGKVFGFTHDGSGRVITIDPKTGVGTLFNTFTNAGKGISFSGAGVNPKVNPIS